MEILQFNSSSSEIPNSELRSRVLWLFSLGFCWALPDSTSFPFPFPSPEALGLPGMVPDDYNCTTEIPRQLIRDSIVTSQLSLVWYHAGQFRADLIPARCLVSPTTAAVHLADVKCYEHGSSSFTCRMCLLSKHDAMWRLSEDANH